MARKPSKYEPLQNYLVEHEPPSLTFDEIDNIIAPNSLTKGEREKHGICNTSLFGIAALRAGFSVKVRKNTVYFERCTEEEKRNAEKKKINSPSIILNNIFPDSSYLNNDSNIGHEIIDIFGADNDEFYYYLNKDGQTDNNKVKAVISITKVGNLLYKVVNKAIVEKLLDSAKRSLSPEESYNKQLNKFFYNDRPIEDYLKNNKYNKKYSKSTLATFKCSKIVLPKNEMFIAFGNSKVKANKKKHIYKINVRIPRSLRVVGFTEDEMKTIEEIAKDENWLDETIPSYKSQYKALQNRIGNSEDDLFEVLGIESSELPYSNYLKYILDSTNSVEPFLKKVFGAKSITNSSGRFEVERETFNTDLLFTNFNEVNKTINQKIFIIENKIDSNVTLSDRDAIDIDQQIKKIYLALKEKDDDDKQTQLTYKDMAVIRRIKELVNIADPNQENKIHSQLSKYYIYAVIRAIKAGWRDNKIKEDIKCAFLCPEYSRYQYDVKSGYLNNKEYILENKYKLITYKDVLSFFESQKIKITNPSLKAKYDIFLSAIKLKAKERDDSIEKRMIERFYRMSK